MINDSVVQLLPVSNHKQQRCSLERQPSFTPCIHAKLSCIFRTELGNANSMVIVGLYDPMVCYVFV